MGDHGRIAAGRSCRLSGPHDRVWRLMEADEVTLAVRIGDDERQRMGGGYGIQGAEAQRRGLDTPIVIVP